MSLLEEIWYGRLNPIDCRIRPGSDYDKLKEHVLREEERLLQQMTAEEKALLEKMWDDEAKLEDICLRETYIRGFRNGARIIMEVLGHYDFQWLPVEDADCF